MKLARLPLAALLVALLAGSARAADDTVTISQGVDADTLDPIRVSVTTSTNLHAQVYDYLARVDGPGKWTPELATSWRRVSPTVWEYTLRRGVVFSNGDPFTADDVVFTVNKILDPAYRSQQISRIDTIAKAEAPSPYLVRFTTKRPTPLAPAITRPIFIVDGKYWREHGDAYMNEHPMGTGPYQLKRWAKDDVAEFELNPRYWGPKPQVSRILFKPIPEAGARVAALETGASDVITNVPWQYTTRLAGGRMTRMVSTRSDRVLFIAFNTTQPGPQRDVRVRRALNYAINVPQVIKSVLGGRAYELGEPVPADFVGYDPTVTPYRYDPAQAKKLLADAGFPDGKGLSLTIHTPQGRYNGDKEVALAIAGQLQKFGITVDVRPQEWVTYITQANRKTLAPMFLLGWGNITNDADNTLSTYMSSQSPVSPFSDPSLDKLIDDARYELDPAKRRALYSRAEHTIHDLAPWLFLFQYEDLYATSKRLAWQPRADESIIVAEMRLR